jgi:mono/diheme cytochrome c family protein
MRKFARAAVIAASSYTISIAACAAPDTSQQAVQLARGRVMAEAHCSVCHAVGESDPSPSWVNSNTPFRRLYERYPIAMLEEAASTGRISGHDEMPGFEFPLEDMAALLAYIDSQAPGKPGYSDRSVPN